MLSFINFYFYNIFFILTIFCYLKSFDLFGVESQWPNGWRVRQWPGKRVEFQVESYHSKSDTWYLLAYK